MSETSTERTPESASTGTTAAEPPLREGSVLRTVVFGTVGSLLLMVGSYGVGWLAGVSELRRHPLVIELRFTTPGAILSIILVAIGAMMLVREWFRLGQKLQGWGPGTRTWVRAAIVAWSLPMVFSVPIFSRDVYSYIGQGRVAAAGLSPYESGVSTIENFFQLGADQLWSESPPPYGPLFIMLERLIVGITGAEPDSSVFLFRLLCVLSVMLIAWTVPRLAQRHGIDPTRALWLSAANPLLLVNFILAVHNDATMTALALLGVLVAATWRDWRGGMAGTALVVLSIGIKPITVVLLPFIGLLWAGRGASWPRRFLIWALTLAWAIVVMAVLGWMSGFGWGWIEGLSTTGTSFIWYAPIGLLGLVVSGIVGLFGDAGRAMGAVHSAGQALAVPVILYLMFVGRDERVVRRMTLAFAAIVVFSPMIQAWYVVWLIPFFAVTGIRPDWQTDVLLFLTVFFMIYAVSDQLDVFPYLDIDIGSGRTIAAVIGVAYGIYLWFLDPSTRRSRRTRSADPQRPVVI
ncbi:polyprenol phosphomannose-dependent alpha 1,6 mannosyltransferase MptB [Kocuria palustris]|uniref:polyprenol phosphomannose-dependent alpha 1,6 mannosyltransferase MptB n=1 Tax=Kocuria palustris TaxID=71999 RepID=UPI0011A00B09|nr:polyprenol phosphomannose-dependent alpha 1,6 mannosyltransferase MptB [Kocuria palustris]